MKREEYICTSEMAEFVTLAGTLDGVDNIIQKTTDKEWLKYLKTAATNLKKVLVGRYECIPKEKYRNMVKRRLKECEMHWTSKNGIYNVAPENVEKVTAPLDSFFHICEIVATEHCKGCQITCQSRCLIRKWFEDCGCPAMVGNPNGKCEYWMEDK